MEINYTLVKNDYVEYNLFHHINAKVLERQIVKLIIYIHVAIFLLGILMTKRISVIITFTLAVSFVLNLILKKKIVKKSLIRGMKKEIKDDEMLEFVGDYSLSLLDDKIREVKQYQTHEYSYHTVQSIQFDSERLYFMLVHVRQL